MAIVIGMYCLTDTSIPGAGGQVGAIPMGKIWGSRVDTPFHRIIASAGLPPKTR
ncbi:hypothetical protein CKAH01_12948 [Colletotrichum kahawae]|uniref:Uncharacterized protein n=1 Tax=Colletotrichum kahawae TaxID=34407 RepID=A0AAD9YPX5_COLKA|nr:hypothetical protein CKAH01_12948 [Colletotrichum kahawae]